MQTANQINLPQTGEAFSTVTEPWRKSTPIITGRKAVWGIPLDIKPITDPLPGKMRLRFRFGKCGKVYFRTDTGIRCFALEDCGDHWKPCCEEGRNERSI